MDIFIHRHQDYCLEWSLYVCQSLSHVQLFATPRTVTHQVPLTVEFSRSRIEWNSPLKNTGVRSHSFLQGILPTQELNPGLLQCRQILYRLSHPGSPSDRYNIQITKKKKKKQSKCLSWGNWEDRDQPCPLEALKMRQWI